MTQIFTGTGLGGHGSSLDQLGNYGPKGAAGLGQGGGSVYLNAASGNLWLKQSDGFLAEAGLGLDLFQSYNSRGEGGNTWRFNFETRLMFEGVPNSAGSLVKRVDEDGHISSYRYDENAYVYRACDGSNATLIFAQGNWQYQDGSSQTRCNYDRNGQLSSISDRDGHVLTVRYQNGHLASITDNSGKQNITWLFDKGLLRDVSFQSDGVTVHHRHFEYDSLNRLSRVTQDLGDGKTYQIRYEYAGDTNLISDIHQSDGTSLHIDYDAEGRVKCLVDGEGRVTRYQYLAGETIMTNGLGESWHYFYDSENRLTGIDGPINYRIRYHYDGKHLDSVTEGNQRWQFTWNDAGDCVRTESPTGEVLLRTFDPEHHLLSETRFQAFDGTHQPIKPVTTRYVYDESGHLRFEISPDGTVSEYRYNSEGLLTSSRVYLGAQTAIDAEIQNLSLQELVTWGAAQNQQAISLVVWSYDWRGCVTAETRFTEIDEQGNGILTNDSLIRYSRYDASGRLVEKSASGENGIHRTWYFYDDLGRLTKTVDNQQHEQSIEYDDTHQRIIKTDANGLQTIELYDHSGLLLTRQRLDSGHDYGRVTYQYDALSRLVAETGVDGKTSYFFYDAEGRLQAGISSNGQVTEYGYDDNGNCVLTHQYHQGIERKRIQDNLFNWREIKPETAANDRITQMVYNAQGQLAWEVDAEGAVIGYRYDAQNRLIAKTAYANRLTDFIPSQRLLPKDMTMVADERDRCITWYYDSMGRLQGEINGEGGATGYRYDKLGHLVERRQYGNKAALERSGDWLIDAPANADKKDICQHSLYNVAGLKIADIDAENYLTEYQYDTRGLLTGRIAWYTGLGGNFVFDENISLENLRPLSHKNDHEIHYSYNDLNQLVKETSANGLVIRYAYNEQGLVVSKISEDVKTHELRQQRYRYDALGRVIQSLDALGAALLEQNNDANDEVIDIIWMQHSVRYVYDIAGRLLSETNALNQQTQFFYNEKGLLIYTLTASGAVTETRYNAFQQVETSIRYSERWTGKRDVNQKELQEFLKQAADASVDEASHYEYNNLGLVTSVRKGAGCKLQTTYNAFGELEQTNELVSLSQTNITNFQYDRRGLLRSRTDNVDALNKINRFEYDAAGRLVKAVNSTAGASMFFLNRRGEQLRVYDPGHGFNTISYDAYGRMLTVSGKTNQTFTYDDKNSLLTLSRMGAGGSIVTKFNAFGDKISVTDGNKQTTHYQYDAKSQLIHVEAPEGSTMDYSYDAEGHLLFQEDAGGHSIRYTWDAEARMLSKAIDPDGLNQLINYTYDGIGRQLLINENGKQTSFSYDNQGNLLKKCLDPNGLNLITEFVYTENGHLSQQITRNPQGIDKVITYTWDALGRCVSTTIDPDGLALTTGYEYDLNGNLLCQIEPSQQRIQFIYDANNHVRYRIDARGVVTEHVYDVNGNEIKTIVYANRLESGVRYRDEKNLKVALHPDISSDHYQFFAYDKQNRLLRSYDGLGNATYYAYDANDNVIFKKIYAIPCSVDALLKGVYPSATGGVSDRITQFAYDGLNQLRFQINPDGRLTEYQYDSAGQKIKETRFAQAYNFVSGGNYSVSDILSHLKIDDKDESRYYTYDKAGRLIAEANPSGFVSSYQYDDAGNLVMSTRFAEALSDVQLAKKDWTSRLQPGSSDRTSRFVFDAAGRELYRISASGHVVERRYDVNGNVLLEIAHEKTLEAGLLLLESIQQALEDGAEDHVTSFDYDIAGRLLAKTDANNQITRYRYDKSGNVIMKIDARNACWAYDYDEVNQLIESHSPETIVSSWINGVLVDEKKSITTQNAYDSFGNLITEIRDADGLKQRIDYRYDAMNRSVASIYPDRMVNQAGPSAGNARVEEKTTLTETRRYNAFGELIESCDRAGHSRHWIYDNSGKMIYQIDANNALTRYTYDAFDNVQTKTSYINALSLPKGNYSRAEINKILDTDKNDRHEFYSYDKNHQLIESRKDVLVSFNSRTGEYHQLSPTTRFQYNAFGELVRHEVKLSDVDWAITQSTYNLDGLKTASLDAEGYLTSYSYNAFGWLEAETQYAERTGTDEKGFIKPDSNSKDRAVTFVYDAVGQLSSKTLKNATWQQLSSTDFQYEDKTGDLTSSYQYDALGNLVKTTDALGNTVYSYYNESGQLTTQVGAMSRAGRPATSYRYDAMGMLVEARQWAGGAIEANETAFNLNAASSEDIIQQNFYDNAGQLIQQTNAMGHTVNYSFDANGNIARRWQLLTQIDDSLLLQDIRYTWDVGNHLTQTATLKTNGSFATEDTRYNIFGEMTARGVEGVMSTRIDYDKSGRVWRSNAQGYFQIFVYDLADHVTQVVTSTNACGVEYINNGVDLSNSTFDDDISFNKGPLSYDLRRQDNIYDGLGHLLSQTKDGSMTSVDKQNNTEIQRATQKQKVDRWGNVISHCNANGHTTLYEYNIFNEVSVQTMPEVMVVDEHGVASRRSPVSRIAYDALGRAIAVTDANGHTVAKMLDAEGCVISEIDAKGNHRDKEYNLLGQMVESSNERAAKTTYLYDKANRLVSISTSQGTQNYKYDAVGQLIQTAVFGSQTKYWYDTLGRQIQRVEAWNGDFAQYEYDTAGRKIAEHDANGNTQTWAYDNNGRLIAHTDLSGHNTVYTYNTNGLLLTEKSSHGKDMVYHYFSDGLLRQYVDNSRKEVVDYTYDAEGQMLSKDSLRIGAWTLETDHYQYDALGRLVQVRRRNPDDEDKNYPDADKSFLSIDYEYDAVGNIRASKVMTNYPKTQRQTHEDYFLYDENNRIIVNKGQLQNGNIVMTASQGSATSYDEAGNIKTAVKYEDGVQQHYAYRYNEVNLLEEIRKNGYDLQTKSYDKAGRVASEQHYDAQGLMTERNNMIYEQGRLMGLVTHDFNELEVSKTCYAYDSVGNLVLQVTAAPSRAQSTGYTQSHQYSYQLWDTYQQHTDTAVLTMDGQAATSGKSTRIYDVNGQLSDAIDSQSDSKGKNNSRHYLTSSVDGIRARTDSEGQTSYLTVADRTIGDLRQDTNGPTRLDVYSGFTPTGIGEIGVRTVMAQWANSATPQNNNMMSFLASFKKLGDATLPDAPNEGLGTYTLHVGDTLEGIALQVYGDSSLWYLIADANGITDRNAYTGEKGSQLHNGQRLTIPPVQGAQHHTNSTRKIMYGSDTIGNTSATTPMPPVPPPPKHHSSPWRIVTSIVVAVIATVATVLTAGALGVVTSAVVSTGGLGGLIGAGFSVLGGGASLSAVTSIGFTAGFIGSVAAQGAANALGLQRGIDFQGALITGLGTAVTAGVGRLLSSSASYGKLMGAMDKLPHEVFSIRNAAEMMERDALGQGLNLATRGHQKFDWLELGISAATAGFMGGDRGRAFDNAMQQNFGKTSSIISSELQSITGNLATSAVTGQHFDAAKVLTENLGGALSSSLLQMDEIPGLSALAVGANAKFEEEVNNILLEKTKLSSINNAAESEQAIDDLYGLEFNSELLHSGKFDFDGNVPWRYKHGVKQFINDPIGSIDAMRLSQDSNTSNFDLLQNLIFDHEGGIVEHPNDLGGFTNKGITIGTFKSYAQIDLGVAPTLMNLKKITNEQATIIYKKRFWEPLRADEINSMSLAYALYDFHVNAPGNAIKIMQQSINHLGGKLIVDNKMGLKTLKEINKVKAHELFKLYQENRINYYINRVEKIPDQKVFLNGWLERVDKIKFER